MSVISDVNRYELWLRKHCDVVERGLKKKHKRMADDPLMFFRSTCFRFARKINEFVAPENAGPKTLSVGDAHFENWGTWRDAEGRLVWGVNDFDEAAELPYTFDLVRMATSLSLAKDLPNQLPNQLGALLKGYTAGLQKPTARLINDEVPWMEPLLKRPISQKNAFEQSLLELLDKHEATPPPQALAGLIAEMPVGTSNLRFASRQRGGGSLGRPRFVAFGRWQGGLIVRECKAIVPSAWAWASDQGDHARLFITLARGTYRAPDPFLKSHDGYLIRRIASDSNKIDLASLNARAFNLGLLKAMGADLASIHAATSGASSEIEADLTSKKPEWLLEACTLADKAVRQDYDKWKAHYRLHKDG
ncbi:DUF2252 family protein [Rhizobium tubonense]|uniref:DUF2252 domain-containing protein n=1 Tax=Rhizobium tubonense TaxID=484088 RepID=A0A2W4C2M0_9HYPH|nr:DUF2252 family protein [Rhizobium tubonense]PZM08059.1 hypothetical protein CPY51_30410 [Rhizobium tubonense]